MSGILVRGPPPPYCRITAPPTFTPPDAAVPMKVGFYKLARPTVPDNHLFDTPLTDAERQLAVQTIVATGQTGLAFGTSGHLFIMMEPAAIGWGQAHPRVSRQLSVRTKGGRIWKFAPICTKQDCFSTYYTETSEMSPKCLTHKGDQVGYAVVEYGRHNAAGQLTQVGHAFMSYHYDPVQKQRHFEVAVRGAKKPPGTLLRDLHFDDAESARRAFTVWQTTRFLQSLNDPQLRFTSKSVSLANGLEQDMLNEFTLHRLRMTATPWPGYVPFPLGTRLYPTDKLEDVVNDNIGALYIHTDDRVVYGGLSMDKKMRRLALRDTLVEYLLTSMTFCPVAAVPRGELPKMEAHLIVCLYLGYLLGLRNPFILKYSQTQPYCLNLETITSFFDDNSWTRITDFMKCIYAHNVNLSPY